MKFKNVQKNALFMNLLPKGQNMQTCTEKVSIFGVVKS